jgi:tetratricopeptide (TPR) repeat protein
MFIRLLLLAAAATCVCAAQSRCDADVAFRSAQNLLAGNQYEQAAKTLDGLRRCATLSNLQTFEMGWLYGRARRFDVALEVFGKVSEDVPDRQTHGYAVALARFELSDFRGAIATLTALRAAGLSDPNSTNLLAVAYAKSGLYREAYEVLSNAAATSPADLPTWMNLVTVCAEGGDFAKAAEVAEKAAQLFPRESDVFVVRGAASMLLGRVDAAAGDFATAVRLAPARADARFFLALTKYQRGDFADAVQILRSAAKEGIADSDLHYLTAECLLKMDAANTKPSLDELKRAIALNSASVPARILRGKLLLESGRAGDAVEDLELARRTSPDSRSATYNLARAYRALGRTSDAQKLLRGLQTESENALLEEISRERLDNAVLGRGDPAK